MNCPTCTSERLVMTERSGIEIDYCPSCRGVWLDRGELDKLIERSAASLAPAAPQAAAHLPPQPLPQPAPQQVVYRDRKWDDDDDDDYWRKRSGAYGGRLKKKKGLLGEIFDF